MGKSSSDIIEWGVIKPFFDKTYQFNTIDIETIENELFLFGYSKNKNHTYKLEHFYNVFHDLLIQSVQCNHDILTWSRYDNTHLVKLLLQGVSKPSKILLRIGKISPIYEYHYKSFQIQIRNIIKDSIIFSITDCNERAQTVTLYNLKNLFQGDLLSTCKDYGITWYSKLGEEYHIIDKERFFQDKEYKRMVVLANKYDNLVLLDIASHFLENFKSITGVYPKSIFTAGSIARSYLLAYSKRYGEIDLHYRSIFKKSKKREILLDYSMRAYHGGKIESYVLGYIAKGKVIDITSAYPYAMANLPKLKNKIHIVKGSAGLEGFFYAYIHCNVFIEDKNLIHPLIYESPINKANLSPYGYLKDMIITKVEYDYLIRKKVQIEVLDYIGVEHEEGVFPYKALIMDIFEKRMQAKRDGHGGLADLFKTIINSLYGITQELTDVYEEDEFGNIEWKGYRAGDYFNSVISSHITAFTRTYLSDVSHNIIENGGEVYLNMTDSILFDGNVTLDVFSEKKTLGKFEPAETIKNIMILGAGRYEYQSEFNEKYTIKNRGFNVKVKSSSFYSTLNLKDKVKIKHRTFVTSYKATSKKYHFQQMGHLIDDDYEINPFNLGGKRVIENDKIDLQKEYTKTYPVYIEKDFYPEK